VVRLSWRLGSGPFLPLSILPKLRVAPSPPESTIFYDCLPRIRFFSLWLSTLWRSAELAVCSFFCVFSLLLCVPLQPFDAGSIFDVPEAVAASSFLDLGVIYLGAPIFLEPCIPPFLFRLSPPLLPSINLVHLFRVKMALAIAVCCPPYCTKI